MDQPNLDFATTLIMRHTYQAPRERVFSAWTDPAALEQWFKPMGIPTRVPHLELRVGGSFRIELTNADKDITGTYLVIEPPEKLVFTWVSPATQHQETIVTLELIDHAGTTELILTHERFADEIMRQLHLAGWDSVMDQIEEVL